MKPIFLLSLLLLTGMAGDAQKDTARDAFTFLADSPFTVFDRSFLQLHLPKRSPKFDSVYIHGQLLMIDTAMGLDGFGADAAYWIIFWQQKQIDSLIHALRPKQIGQPNAWIWYTDSTGNKKWYGRDPVRKP
jgi:hypothetical protein